METTVILVKETLGLIRNKFKLLVLSWLLIAGVAGLMMLGVGVIGGVVYWLLSVARLTLLATLIGIVGFLAGIYFLFYLQAWGYLTLALAIVSNKPGITARDNAKIAWGKVRGYWGLMILSALVVVGAFIPLLVPAIILSLTVSISLYVYLLENEGGLSALLKSRFYIQGYRWVTFVRYVIVFIIPIAMQVGLNGLKDSSNEVVSFMASGGDDGIKYGVVDCGNGF